MKRRGLILGTLAVATALCAIGAVGTAIWMIRFGLFGPQAPLSTLETMVRLALMISGAVLFLARRDLLERTLLMRIIVAAGSSFLFGLGVRPDVLAAVRLIFHFLAYSLGIVAIVRIWLTVEGKRRSPANDIDREL